MSRTTRALVNAMAPRVTIRRNRAPPTPEDLLQAAIIELAELLGWRVYHVEDVHKRLRAKTSEGFLDLVMARTGRCIIAELKSDTGVTTKAQDAWLSVLESCEGVETAVWRPVDWHNGDVERTLRRSP